MDDSYSSIILVTGVAGFIGSNFITYMVKKYSQIYFIGVDKLSYSSNLQNIDSIRRSQNFKFYKYDITNMTQMTKLFSDHMINTIIHFAAYTHVDHSFGNSLDFTKNNIIGTHVLLEYSKNNHIEKFIYVSTDEVYGSKDTSSNEESILNPTNPYAATKADRKSVV